MRYNFKEELAQLEFWLKVNQEDQEEGLGPEYHPKFLLGERSAIMMMKTYLEYRRTVDLPA